MLPRANVRRNRQRSHSRETTPHQPTIAEQEGEELLPNNTHANESYSSSNHANHHTQQPSHVSDGETSSNGSESHLLPPSSSVVDESVVEDMSLPPAQVDQLPQATLVQHPKHTKTVTIDVSNNNNNNNNNNSLSTHPVTDPMALINIKMLDYSGPGAGDAVQDLFKVSSFSKSAGIRSTQDHHCPHGHTVSCFVCDNGQGDFQLSCTSQEQLSEVSMDVHLKKKEGALLLLPVHSERGCERGLGTATLRYQAGDHSCVSHQQSGLAPAPPLHLGMFPGLTEHPYNPPGRVSRSGGLDSGGVNTEYPAPSHRQTGGEIPIRAHQDQARSESFRFTSAMMPAQHKDVSSCFKTTNPHPWEDLDCICERNESEFQQRSLPSPYAVSHDLAPGINIQDPFTNLRAEQNDKGCGQPALVRVLTHPDAVVMSQEGGVGSGTRSHLGGRGTSAVLYPQATKVNKYFSV